MTLLLAVKIASVVLSSANQVTFQRVKSLESVNESIVRFDVPGWPGQHGAATLIDSSGLFIVGTGSELIPSILGKNSKGEPITLMLVQKDEIVQLAVYQASPWDPSAPSKPFQVATFKEMASQKLFAALPEKFLIGEVVSQSRTGIVQPSNRYVPLSEIRFEDPSVPYGGSPVFTLDGKLAGILNAALIPMNVEQRAVAKLDNSGKVKSATEFGPKALSIGFSLAPSVLKRVIDGFRSEDHTPKHPTIGIFYGNHPDGGAEIRTVDAKSPGDLAGLKPGDIILQVDGKPIRDVIVLASILFDSQIGKERSFGIVRDSKKVTIKVKVGAMTAPSVKGPAIPVGNRQQAFCI